MKSTFLLYSVWIISHLGILLYQSNTAVAQEPAFEIPVELIGFPVIVIAVRISNLVKKLAYSLNPNTYVPRRTRRSVPSISSDEMIDIMEAEKRLVSELGDSVCIYPKICLYYAEKSRRSNGRQDMNIDWDEIFGNYKASNEKQKEFYFLSVFLGDFIASPKFCNQLVKRGRACIE